MQILAFFVFVITVAIATSAFGYGLSLLRANLEPLIPDAPRDAAQE